MSTKNRTIVTEFIFLGFTSDLRINIFLFVLFLSIYILTFSGNCLIMCLIVITPQLHIPMYLLLCFLAFLDLCTLTSVVPRLLSDFLSTGRSISYMACVLQLNIVLFIAGTECFLLALMAYDRYVAICCPLHYPLLMSWRTCYSLTALVWIISLVVIIIPNLATLLDLCYLNQINHFMCESVAVAQLACEIIFVNDIVTSVTCFTSLFLPVVFIVASYTCIISSVLKIPSAGRSKAFSTCTSHITVVALAYGSGIIMYSNPTSQYSMKYGKYFSLFSLIICLALNPLIYTLSNKEVKATIRKILSTNFYHNWVTIEVSPWVFPVVGLRSVGVLG